MKTTIEILESLLVAEGNLLLWSSHPDSGSKRFFVWHTLLGSRLAGPGEPTIEAALLKFREYHGKDLLRARAKWIETMRAERVQWEP